MKQLFTTGEDGREKVKHLFTNGTDTVIAESPKEAIEAWEYHTGEIDTSGEVWLKVPDDEPFTVYFEDEIKPEYLPAEHTRRELDPDSGESEGDMWTHCITATAGAWANSNWQDGFLCSTEY